MGVSTAGVVIVPASTQLRSVPSGLMIISAVSPMRRGTTGAGTPISRNPAAPLWHQADIRACVTDRPTEWSASPQYFIDLPGLPLASDTLFALCQSAAKQ